MYVMRISVTVTVSVDWPLNLKSSTLEMTVAVILTTAITSNFLV